MRKRKLISLVLLVVTLLSMYSSSVCASSESERSIRYVKSASFSSEAGAANYYVSVLYLEPKEAYELADTFRPSGTMNTAAYLLGGLLGPYGILEGGYYLVWSETQSAIASKIQNATYNLPDGKLLRVEFKSLEVDGEMSPIRVELKNVDRYPTDVYSIMPSSTDTIDDVKYIYFDDINMG